MKKFLIAFCLNTIVLCAGANNYYVSSTGNDANSGLNTSQAWASINKINSFSFAAGDSLLFEGGGIFTGWINNTSLSNGTVGDRITIASYGTGKATINSFLDEGISLTNAGNLTIKNLIFKGSGYKLSGLYTSGIDIYIDSLANANSENIILDSLETMGYGAWGILVTTDSKTYGYKNLNVTNSLLHDNGIGGFELLGYMDTSTLHANGFNNQDVYIGYVKSYNNPGRLDFTDNWSGSGILIGGTVNGMIENCEAYNNGKENGSYYAGPVGIFLGDSKYVTIQHCSSHGNSGGPGKKDGGGFDLDQGAYGCVIQYCDSYDNQGAGYGLYQAPSANPWSNDTIRYNTSTNDASNYGVYGAITFWGAGPTYKVTNAEVYANQVNMSKSGYALFFLNNNLTNINVHDNIFCLQQPSSYLNYNGLYPIASNATVYKSTFPCAVQPQTPFISPVTYRGGFAPSPIVMWTDGWTNYDPQNAVYPAIDSTIESSITSSITLSGSKKYLVKGLVYVKNGATLTIQPGCILRGDKTVANSSLIITRGARISAAGTLSKPIVFTSNQPAGARAKGDWGGLIILGNAPCNGTGGEQYIEGLPTSSDTQFGGGAMPDDNDSSGVLQYVRLEFGGYSIAAGQEINGLTLGAVGRGTTIDHVQVSYSNDDGFEWRGGSVNCKYLVSYKNRDDDWEVNNGYHGAVQFCLGLRDPDMSDDPSSSTSEGIESSNDETGSDATGYTSAIFSNITEIGPLRGNVSANVATMYKRSIHFANNAHVRMVNSIMMDFPIGVSVDGALCTALATSNYLSPVANKSPGNLVFKNNLVAGNKSGKVLEKNVDWNMADWFAANKNDSLESTANLLVLPYATDANNVDSGDYRPATGSAALSNYNWNDSAFYHIDSTGIKNNFITCPVNLAAPGLILGPTNPYTYIQSGDSAKYYISTKSIFGVLKQMWTVPAGVTIQSGQGTDTLIVKFANTYTSGNIVAQNLSYCGVLSGSRILAVKKVLPVIYTFIGDGNWNVSNNWSNGAIPPASLPSGSEIIIAPALNGSCILNVPQTILSGGKLTVQQNKNFIIQGNLSAK